MKFGSTKHGKIKNVFKVMFTIDRQFVLIALYYKYNIIFVNNIKYIKYLIICRI